MEKKGQIVPSKTGLTTLTAIENKILNVSNLIKKQIMIQKCQIVRINILPLLIIISLWVKQQNS